MIDKYNKDNRTNRIIFCKRISWYIVLKAFRSSVSTEAATRGAL